jgi:hypothetical protein
MEKGKRPDQNRSDILPFSTSISFVPHDFNFYPEGDETGLAMSVEPQAPRLVI